MTGIYIFVTVYFNYIILLSYDSMHNLPIKVIMSNIESMHTS